MNIEKFYSEIKELIPNIQEYWGGCLTLFFKGKRYDIYQDGRYYIKEEPQVPQQDMVIRYLTGYLGLDRQDLKVLELNPADLRPGGNGRVQDILAHLRRGF